MNRLDEILNRKPSRWGNMMTKEFERDIKLLQDEVRKHRDKNTSKKVNYIEDEYIVWCTDNEKKKKLDVMGIVLYKAKLSPVFIFKTKLCIEDLRKVEGVLSVSRNYYSDIDV